MLTKVEEEKDLGVIISGDLKCSKQCARAANTGNKLLGIVKRTFKTKSVKIMVPLYKSIIRPHLEYAVQAWRPHLKKDIEMLEAVQHRATKCIEGLGGLNYNERLDKLKLPSLEFRRTRGDLIEMFKMYKGLSGLNFDEYFCRSSTGLRGHQGKVFKGRFNTNIGKFLFTNRIIDLWNGLPNNALLCNKVDNFKGYVDKYLRVDRGML